MKIYKYDEWVDDIFGTDTKIRVAHNNLVFGTLKKPTWVVDLEIGISHEKIGKLDKFLHKHFPNRAFRYAGSTCIFEDRNDILMFTLQWSGDNEIK